ncbi:hypothetical protein SD80_016490 [Scytonema tolypothrichoides VB-61278]|nr:hypothetical protein SD80_016490 [Scytonema tolypothrichoides VB-61278]
MRSCTSINNEAEPRYLVPRLSLGTRVGRRSLPIIENAARSQLKWTKVDLFSSSLQKLREVSLELMKLLGPLDYATFDFRIAYDGQVYLLDVNADATLHPQRSFAQIAYAAGLSYQQLISVILKTSLERWK